MDSETQLELKLQLETLCYRNQEKAQKSILKLDLKLFTWFKHR